MHHQSDHVVATSLKRCVLAGKYCGGGTMFTFARRSIYGEAKTAVGISIRMIERGCEADGAERISPPGDGR
jgi:hypothetical protein